MTDLPVRRGAPASAAGGEGPAGPAGAAGPRGCAPHLLGFPEV